MPTTDERRAQLLAWIARTKRIQRGLGIVLAGLLILSIALLFVSKPIGGFALAMTALTAVCGFWITGGHIIDWRGQIAGLDKPKIVGRAGGGRRF